jgi:hypothetical protein
MVSIWINRLTRFWHIWMLILVVAVGVVVGSGPALLVTAGFLLLTAILSFYASLSVMETAHVLSLDEALDLAAPMASEQHKMVVLRGLKDLKYEHQVGKISEEDYQLLTQRYRAEAMTLLGEMDQSDSSIRERIEQLVEERLRSETDTSVAISFDKVAGASSGDKSGVS